MGTVTSSTFHEAIASREGWIVIFFGLIMIAMCTTKVSSSLSHVTEEALLGLRADQVESLSSKFLRELLTDQTPAGAYGGKLPEGRHSRGL